MAQDNLEDLLDQAEVFVPESQLLNPYAGIPPNEWGQYQDPKDGYKVKPLPENWRRFSFKVKYPTTKLQNQLYRHSQIQAVESIEGQKEKGQVSHYDAPKLIKFHVYQVIFGIEVEGVDTPMSYTDKAKEKLYANFLTAPFLWARYLDSWNEMVKRVTGAREEDSENFIKPSESTPESTSSKTELSSAEKT